MLKLFQTLSAVLALLAIALVSALLTMRLAIHGAEVHVPALAGLPISQAVLRAHRLGLEAAIDGHFYSTAQPAGHVLTQRPAPGTLVRKAWRVQITESLGPQKVAIPDVMGMDRDMAAITVRRTGLQVGDQAAMPYPYAAADTVIAQTPGGHATDVEDPAVGILVAQADAQQPAAYVMPDLIGETFTVAALAATRAGFHIAPVKEAPSALTTGLSSLAAAAPQSAGQSPSIAPLSAIPPVPAYVPSGTVVAQSPAAGTQVIAGATIQLTVQP